jgi:arylsulfatase A-like enzyme
MKMSDSNPIYKNILLGIFLCLIGGVLFWIVECMQNIITGKQLEVKKIFLSLLVYCSINILFGLLIGFVFIFSNKLKTTRRRMELININSMYAALSISILPFLLVLFEINVKFLPSIKSVASILADIGVAAIFIVFYVILYKLFNKYPPTDRKFVNSYLATALILNVIIIDWMYLSFHFTLTKYLSRLIIINISLLGAIVLIANLFFNALKPKFSIKRLALPVGILISSIVIFILIWLQQIQPTALQHKEVKLPQKHLPPIILITIDTLRADHLSCYGSNKVKTPVIDALAKKGILFNKAISQCPWTTPSIASILSSLCPSIHKGGEIVGEGESKSFRKIAESIALLPEILKKQGYFTQAILSNPQLTKEQGFTKGFVGFHNFDDSYYEIPGLFYLRLLKNIRSNVSNQWYTPGDIITKEVIGWLNKYHKSSFFLWIHYTDPHIPYQPAKKYLKNLNYKSKFKDKRVLDFGKIRSGNYNIISDDREYIESLYNGEIRFADDQLGIVISKLKKLGIFDKTLIILTSDHGEEFWEHLGFEHGHTVYDELLHIPLIIHFGNLYPSKNKVIKNQVRLIDIFPTVLDFLNIKHQSFIQGRSLMPIIAGKEEKRTAFSEYLYRGKERKSIINDGFKYIYFPDIDREELYDLKRDPGELTNLITLNKEKAARLREQLISIIENNQKIAEIVIKDKQINIIEMNEMLKKQLKALGYIQ